MPIDYTGPPSLREIFESEYAKISQDYNRTKPNIRVGWHYSTLFQDRKHSSEKITFESREHLNSFIEEKIITLRNLLGRQRRSASALIEKQIMHELVELEKARFSSLAKSNRIETIALYDPTIDAVYCDPAIAAFYAIFGGVGGGHSINVLGDLKHELVHYDLGLTVCEAEARRIGLQYFFFEKHESAFIRAAEEGTLETWLTNPENGEFAEKLRLAQREVSGEALRLEMGRLLEGLELNIAKVADLGIKIAGEAVAYNFYGGQGGFSYFVKDKFRHLHREAMRVYVALGTKLRRNGKAVTIRQVEDAINKAYVENREVFGLLL